MALEITRKKRRFVTVEVVVWPIRGEREEELRKHQRYGSENVTTIG